MREQWVSRVGSLFLFAKLLKCVGFACLLMHVVGSCSLHYIVYSLTRFETLDNQVWRITRRIRVV